MTRASPLSDEREENAWKRGLSNIDRWETHHNVVAARLLQHVGDQFGGDRRPTLVLFVLARIGEEGDDGRNPLRARDLAGVDHDAELHERSVDLPTAGVDDVDVILADGLGDAHVGFTNPGFRDRRSRDGDAETVGDVRSVREWKAVEGMYRRAMIPASSGWLVPVRRPARHDS